MSSIMTTKLDRRMGKLKNKRASEANKSARYLVRDSSVIFHIVHTAM